MEKTCQLRAQETAAEIRRIQETSRKSMLNEQQLQEELEACRQEVESVKKHAREAGSFLDPCSRIGDSPSASPVAEFTRGRQPGAVPPCAPPPTPEKHPAACGGARLTPTRAMSCNRGMPTGNSSHIRSASNHTPATEEAPKAGVVRELSKKLETRVASQTPQGRGPSPSASSRPNQRDGRGRNSRDGAARTPPALPKTVPAAALSLNLRALPPPFGFDSSYNDDEPTAGVVHDMGMSPLSRNAPARNSPIADISARSPFCLPAETESTEIGRACDGWMRGGCGGSLPAAVVPSTRAPQTSDPEATTSEISVRQRINQFRQLVR